MWLEERCNFSKFTSFRRVQLYSPRKILKTKNAGEAISGHFAKRFKVSNLPELCLFAAVSEEKVPINFFLLNVFEHKIEVIMSWQICREVLNAYVDPAYQPENKFRNLKTGSFQSKAGESYL